VSAAKDSRAIDHHKFTLVRPLIGAYRILAHIFPFLAVTLVVTQHMIEESRLPKRTFLGRSERHRDCSLQSVHPLRQLEVIPASNEKVHVIRHDQISSDGHAKFITSSADAGFE